MSSSPRRRTLALCALPLVALLAVACLAPLPFTVAQPGITANVLGSYKGQQVITVKGADEDAPSEGELRMVTIAATGPQASVRIADVVDGWFATDREVLPRSAVYPVGDNVKEIERHGRKQMQTSQNHAVSAALDELNLSPDDVTVKLRLADVGGPSAGLLFTLGIIDSLGDNGHRRRRGGPGRRHPAQDAGGAPGRGHRLPRAEGGVRRREGRAAVRHAAGAGDDAGRRAQGPKGAAQRRSRPALPDRLRSTSAADLPGAG
jgi:PDZ domain-containing secreted protein